jgi:hypothetical protein
MGYSGLSSWGDSDEAADLASYAVDAMVKKLRGGLRRKATSYNTDGPINVALIFEGFICKNKGFLTSYSPELVKLAEDTLTAMEKEITKGKKQSAEDWGGSSNKQMHLRAYKRMAKNLQKFIKDSET